MGMGGGKLEMGGDVGNGGGRELGMGRVGDGLNGVRGMMVFVVVVSGVVVWLKE